MKRYITDTLNRILICRTCCQPLVTDDDLVKCGCKVYDGIYIMPEEQMKLASKNFSPEREGGNADGNCKRFRRQP